MQITVPETATTPSSHDWSRNDNAGSRTWTRWCCRLYAKGLTTGEPSAHPTEVYGTSVYKDTISRITNQVLKEMQAWRTRPLEKDYAAIFPAAFMAKARDGQARQPARSTPQSESTWTATRTSWVCGPAKATANRPSTGSRC